MPLETFTDDEMREYIRALIRENATDPDLSRLSDWDIEARILTKLFMGNQAQALSIAKQQDPRTCDDSSLVDLATARGLTVYEAATYTGRAVFGGTVGGTIPANTRFVTPDGREFYSTDEANIAVSAWTGKTVGEYSTRTRIAVSPNTSGMAVGDIFVPGPGNQLHVIKSIITGSPLVELYRRQEEDRAVADGVAAVAGCVVLLRAAAAGNDYQLQPWDKLSLAESISDVEDDGVVIEMSGGGDAETPDELRARIIAFDEARPGSGNDASFIYWARKTPGIRVGKAFVFPNVIAPGVTSIVALGVSGSRKLSNENLAAITRYITEQASVSEVLDVRTADFSTDVDVRIVADVGAGYEPDWGPTLDTLTTPSSFEIDPVGITSTFLPLTTSAVGVIEVGDRVLVPTEIGGRWATAQRIVSAVVAGGITLADPLEVAPAAGELVRSGGPAAVPLINAIRTMFDELGPSVGTERYVRFSTPSQSSPSRVNVAAILATAMGVAGVENAAVGTPLSDQTPIALGIFAVGKITVSMI